MPQITVPEDVFRRLSELAASLNIPVDAFALPALRRLVDETDAARLETPLPLTGEAWQAAMEEWRRAAASRAHRYPPGFVLDDSRETIYREREDAQL